LAFRCRNRIENRWNHTPFSCRRLTEMANGVEFLREIPCLPHQRLREALKRSQPIPKSARDSGSSYLLPFLQQGFDAGLVEFFWKIFVLVGQQIFQCEFFGRDSVCRDICVSRPGDGVQDQCTKI